MIELSSPNYTINVRNWSRPADILSIFKNRSLQNYCYAFWVSTSDKQILMNIGMSEGSEIGDRIYRKIGNLPGWKYRFTGRYGSSMRLVVEATEKRFDNLKIHKDDVSIHIWDTNDLISPNFNSPTVEAEKKLIRDSKKKFGCIPAGNIQDPNDRNKSLVHRKHFDSLFEMNE
tara:strand:- start:46 stop:564 length:519 start_codon:yes stop_codon:yes gene_type:complete